MVAAEDAADVASVVAAEDAAESASVEATEELEALLVVVAVAAEELPVEATEVAATLLEEEVAPLLATTVHSFTSMTCGVPSEAVVGVRVITQDSVTPFSLETRMGLETLR